MTSYLVDRWAFGIAGNDDITAGDILFISEDEGIINELTDANQFSRPVVLLTSKRGDSLVMKAAREFEKLGGWCQLVFKPSGPVRLEDAFRAAVAWMGTGVVRSSPSSSTDSNHTPFHTHHGSSSESTSLTDASTDSPIATPPQQYALLAGPSSPGLARRHSDIHDAAPRPSFGTRSSTFSYALTDLQHDDERQSPFEDLTPKAETSDNVCLGQALVAIEEKGSVILESVIGSTSPDRKFVVLVIDDNVINRNLLAHWLKKRVRVSFLQWGKC